MPVPASINDLSTIAGNNSPAGSESPTLTDDYLRALSSFIASLRDSSASIDGLAVKKDSSATTGAAILPPGTTAQRPASPQSGMLRYNTDIADFEGYIGGAWVSRSTFTKAVNEAPIVTLASASTMNIGAAGANTISVSGTATITAFDSVASGVIRRLVFQGAAPITHNATSLILPGGANITAASGDTAEFVSLGSGNWRCLGYVRASSLPALREWDESSLQTITLGGLVTIPHGLGVKPTEFDAGIVCETANLNWSPGDSIERVPYFSQSFPNGDGMITWADATNIYVRYGNAGVAVMDKTTGQVNRITIGSWKMKVRWRKIG